MPEMWHQNDNLVSIDLHDVQVNAESHVGRRRRTS